MHFAFNWGMLPQWIPDRKYLGGFQRAKASNILPAYWYTHFTVQGVFPPCILIHTFHSAGCLSPLHADTFHSAGCLLHPSPHCHRFMVNMLASYRVTQMGPLFSSRGNLRDRKGCNLNQDQTHNQLLPFKITDGLEQLYHQHSHYAHTHAHTHTHTHMHMQTHTNSHVHA